MLGMAGDRSLMAEVTSPARISRILRWHGPRFAEFVRGRTDCSPRPTDSTQSPQARFDVTPGKRGDTHIGTESEVPLHKTDLSIQILVCGVRT